MDNKVNKIMFLLIKTYLIGPYWTIRNNYMVASSATNNCLINNLFNFGEKFLTPIIFNLIFFLCNSSNLLIKKFCNKDKYNESKI